MPLERDVTTLDETTWADLDLDDLLGDLDHCRSVIGTMTLTAWLRSPATTAAHAAARARQLEVEPGVSPSVLERLRQFPPLLRETVWAAKTLPTFGSVPLVLASLAVVANLFFLISTHVGFVATATSFVVNMAFHFWTQPRMAAAVASLEFVSVLLLAAQQVVVMGSKQPARSRRVSRIAELNEILRPLRRAAAEVRVPAVVDDFPAEHLRIMYQSRQRRLSRSATLIEARKAELSELIGLLGEIDAAASVAEYREAKKTCTPQFDDSANAIELVDARHPVLPKAVTNSLLLSGGLVITGSNMSGKSTFLRTVAVNALCAQSLGFACATSYRAPLVRIASSLRNSDRLSAGESTYFAEAKRMRELLDFAGQSPRLLLLVDEPFRGTNSSERIAAGTAVLAYALEQGALVIAATHDLELSELLSTTFTQAHFVDGVNEHGMSFDYLLRPGLAGPRNAVKLLASLGYPKSVIDTATRLLNATRAP